MGKMDEIRKLREARAGTVTVKQERIILVGEAPPPIKLCEPGQPNIWVCNHCVEKDKRIAELEALLAKKRAAKAAQQRRHRAKSV